jgi:uncharacterized membrane protein
MADQDRVPGTGVRRDQTLASATRLWELDLLRGVAILGMVVYHLAWDLAFLTDAPLDVMAGGWWLLARTTATLFLLLVGLSSALRYDRLVRAGWTERAIFRRFLRRGLQIFGWGMVITGVTWLVVPAAYVRFGILHLIGTTTVLAYPFVRLTSRRLLFLATLLVLASGPLVREARPSSAGLLWLGLVPAGFTSVDHFPLLPWFGVPLLGILIARLAYAGAQRGWALADCSAWLPVRALRWLGQHSLIIYLIHQPLLLAGVGGWQLLVRHAPLPGL